MAYQDALSAMAANGLRPPEIIADGKIHRFKVEGDRNGKKNGWYCGFENPLVVTYGTWKEPGNNHTWSQQGGTQIDDESRQRIQAAMEARRANEAKRKARNAARISKLWATLQPCESHPYLSKKSIRPHGARQIGKRLVVAMRNSQREVVGLQIIFPNGKKRYMKGSQPTGSYYGIGNPNGTLYITEGFATGATIHQLTGSAVAVSFSSGNLGAVTRAMRGALPDTKIVICADNDQWTSIRTAAGEQKNPGVYYANQAAMQSGCDIRIPEFKDVETKPTDFNDLAAIHGDDETKRQLLNEPEPVAAPEAPQAYMPFKPLGFDHNGYYYLPRRTNRVVNITSSGHSSKTNLLSIAPLEWWEQEFPTKTGVDWLLAANFCMRKGEERGAYNGSNVRGCGAWFDEGRSVLHLGDRLLVDFASHEISDFKTRFVYEAKAPMESSVEAKPATAEQGQQLLKLFQELRFEKPVHALQLAGWVTLSPICGALKWRPHAWITGRRGTGKSWIQHNMIEPLLGSAALMVQANSTEAGIRQRLQLDARPVVFDEAEAESQQDRKRIQSIIELARQASSESTAEIAKGTSGGAAMSFRARSMFMMGSVNVNLSMAADETRFSVLPLKNPERTPAEIQRFKAFEKQVYATITDEFCASIRARTYQLIPTIRKNASVFAQAVAEELGSQRIGDQVGTLLAGVCALTSDDLIDLDTAKKWISGIDFSDAEDSEQISDEESCLNELLQAQIRTLRGDKSVAELIAKKLYGDHWEDQNEADEILLRHGLRVEGTMLNIANKHAGLRQLLAGSPWATSWGRIFGRLEGATKPGSVRFGSINSKATRIPITPYVSRDS